MAGEGWGALVRGERQWRGGRDSPRKVISWGDDAQEGLRCDVIDSPVIDCYRLVECRQGSGAEG